jgi:magnesium-transporting ATPase (P-type)
MSVPGQPGSRRTQRPISMYAPKHRSGPDIIAAATTISPAMTAAAAFRWLQLDSPNAITISFLTLAFARLWHVFNMRGINSHLIRNQITENPFVWAALALCVALLLLAIYIPGLSGVLDLRAPGARGWSLILLFSFLPLVVGQAIISILGSRNKYAREQRG